jgi:photosystem II stability/assembly factor-like uncharacterized protein
MAQWVQTNTIPHGSVSAFVANGSRIFSTMWYTVGPDSRLIVVVYRSTDDGTSWVEADSGLTNSIVSSFAVIGDNLFAGTIGDGVFLSTDDGVTWKEVNSGLLNKDINSLASTGTNLFAGTFQGIYLSTNNGTSWTSANMGLPGYPSVNCIASKGESLFAGISFSGVYASTNNGTNWTSVNSGLPDNLHVSCLSASDSSLFATSWGTGVYVSTNSGLNWSNVGLKNTTIYSLVVSDQNVFVGTTGASGGLVFLSTNNGVAWSSADSGLPTFPSTVYALILSGKHLFAGTNSGVWRRPLAEMTTSVNLDFPIMPSEYALGQNYPNPFNPSTTIPFSIPSETFVSLKVFDVLGKEVAIIVSKEMSKGSYNQQWRADNLSSGIYIYRLRTASYTRARKFVLQK